MNVAQNVWDIATAVLPLRLTPDAVRKRLARDALIGGKSPDGKRWVQVDPDRIET